MNEKVIKFTELCHLSRTKGLTKEKHEEKIDLANQMVKEGLMTYNGQYLFVQPEHREYFLCNV